MHDVLEHLASPPPPVVLARALTRVQPDFEVVYQRYAGRIRNLVARMGIPRDDVEDVVQDIFCEVCRLLPDYHGRSHIYSWTYRLAVKAVLVHSRRAARA